MIEYASGKRVIIGLEKGFTFVVQYKFTWMLISRDTRVIWWNTVKYNGRPAFSSIFYMYT